VQWINLKHKAMLFLYAPFKGGVQGEPWFPLKEGS